MGVTLLGIVLLVIGIVSFIINVKICTLDWRDAATVGIGLTGVMGGGAIVLFCFVMLISAHTNIDKKIHDADMQYKSLVKQVECIDSDYEDVSKASVIENVYEWNKDVYDAKYWSGNKWTNWFWSKEYVDSLKYIEMEEYKNDN